MSRNTRNRSVIDTGRRPGRFSPINEDLEFEDAISQRVQPRLETSFTLRAKNTKSKFMLYQELMKYT
jgi:hypothetical protein